jgi:hypothetical protein
MYKVVTKFGTTYNYIHSWKRWRIDHTFLEFSWGKVDKKSVILNITDIQVIQEV